MAMAEYLIRKSQFCAIEERHSSTMMHGPTSRSSSFTIGRVRKASAKGDPIKEATAYRYGGEVRLREDERGRSWVPYAIRGDLMQKRAAELVGQEYPTLSHLQAAMTVEG